MRVERGTLYLTDGQVFLVKPEDGKKFSLTELQKAVGGYIEAAVPANKKSKLWVNEEGLIMNLSPNPHTQTVTDWKAYSTSPMYGPRFRIAGNMLSVYRVNSDESDAWKFTLREVV